MDKIFDILKGSKKPKHKILGLETLERISSIQGIPFMDYYDDVLDILLNLLDEKLLSIGAPTIQTLQQIFLNLKEVCMN